MDNKSIFKEMGKRKSNLCRGSPPDPHFYPPCAPGWRSNRLCVIKWWWWLYLTFVKGGAPDFCRSVLSASIQWINPQTETGWFFFFLFLGVNTGVILRWRKGVFAESHVCFVCIPFSPRACVHWLTCSHHVSLRSLALPPSPATWRRMITYRQVNFISMEMPGRSTDTRDTTRDLSITCSGKTEEIDSGNK